MTRSSRFRLFASGSRSQNSPKLVRAAAASSASFTNGGDDRSAVTDCLKLAGSAFTGRKAILIYGFDDPVRPLAWRIDAFELVASQRVGLGERQETRFGGLVHPIFCAGGVFAWQIV